MRVFEVIFLLILLIGINLGFVLALFKYKISSMVLYIAILVNAIIIVLLITYFDIGLVDFTKDISIKPFDLGLECGEFAAFLAIFCVALVARAKYPVLGGKGWNILLLAVIIGSFGMFLDIYGEFFWINYYPAYKLTTNIFQIGGIIGLALAFLLFYKFSEILFTPPPEK